MKSVYCLNPISNAGMSRFDDTYCIADSIENADAVLLRSASMHEMTLPYSLLAIGRAGAGVNNIPLDSCAKKGIVAHMLVRDDAIELCGFAGQEELNCFKLLMSIIGVGARLALALLSELRPEQIAIAVSSGDSKTLTRANGVGKKLAERIILELKDKLKLISTTSASTSSDFVPTPQVTQGNIQKAVGALAVLGYASNDVLPFMAGIDPDLSVEEIIKLTLKKIGA